MSEYFNYDFENDGIPSTYILGDDYTADSYYMDELWKQVYGFPDYYVSNKGRLYSFKSNNFVSGTPNIRTGHVDVSLWVNSIRHRRLLHRLVAETFIPNPKRYPIVRHLDDDPLNNEVDNLSWGTQTDNMQDSIRNGTFRRLTDEDRELAMQKRRTPIVAINFITEEEIYFNSQQTASRILGVSQSDIWSVISGKRYGSNGYYFAIPDELDYDDFVYSKRHYSKKCPIIKAINIYNGEKITFKGLTEAANKLDMSISSISMVLHGKMSSAKGWKFEYVEEGYRNGIY